MLKIKDNVDLKELEKFGFKPKYDEDTGELKAYYKENKVYEGLEFSKKRVVKKIHIFKSNSKKWKLNYYFTDYFDVDTLYNLIQAGLIEKVGK